jgi:ATP-dependent DNA ligase
MVANFIRMCNLYSITTNQAAIAPLFRVAGLEGVVSKVRDSPYASGHTNSWLKVT